jgi:Barstar (barnase inhibitor)
MNTTLEFLFGVDAPYIYIGSAEAEGEKVIPSCFYSRPGMSVCVRQLRGTKMRTTQGLMNETAAALQFFTGFGENWYALRECLEYLDEWLPADAYVLLIEDAEVLLNEAAPEEMLALLRTLHEVGEWWSRPIVDNGRFNRQPVPFHALLIIAESSQSSASRIVSVAERARIPFRTRHVGSVIIREE